MGCKVPTVTMQMCVPSLTKSKGTSRLVSQEMREKRKKKRKNEGGEYVQSKRIFDTTNMEQNNTGHTLHSATEALDTTATCTMHKSTPQSK